MLVDPTFRRPDPVIAMVAAMNGGSATPERLGQGIYVAGHWNVGDLVVGGVRDRWREDNPVWLDFNDIGVADSPEQVVEKLRLAERPEPFFVSCVPIHRGDQPRDGGWRWHKWGEYIGDHQPTTEYLHDEPDIELVYTFHVYELPAT